MAGTASVYRVTSASDTESDARTANDIVEFNGTSMAPDDNSFASNITIEYNYDISIHPNPARHLSQSQDNKLGTIIVTINGYFSDPDGASGIDEIITWLIADQSNAAFPFGRIGIRWDNLDQFNLNPTATVGYLIKSFVVQDVEEFQDKATFTMVLYKNGTA